MIRAACFRLSKTRSHSRLQLNGFCCFSDRCLLIRVSVTQKLKSVSVVITKASCCSVHARRLTWMQEAAIESHSRGQKGSDLREIANNQDGYIQNSAACVLYFDEISQGA